MALPVQRGGALHSRRQDRRAPGPWRCDDSIRRSSTVTEDPHLGPRSVRSCLAPEGPAGSPALEPVRTGAFSAGSGFPVPAGVVPSAAGMYRFASRIKSPVARPLVAPALVAPALVAPAEKAARPRTAAAVLSLPRAFCTRAPDLSLVAPSWPPRARPAPGCARGRAAGCCRPWPHRPGRRARCGHIPGTRSRRSAAPRRRRSCTARRRAPTPPA
jgi:hypothetical protein